MRRSLLLSLLTGFALFPVVSHAQNYIAADDYRGADVMINMNVLDVSAGRPAPIRSAPLPPLRQPMRQEPVRQVAQPMPIVKAPMAAASVPATPAPIAAQMPTPAPAAMPAPAPAMIAAPAPVAAPAPKLAPAPVMPPVPAPMAASQDKMLTRSNDLPVAKTLPPVAAAVVQPVSPPVSAAISKPIAPVDQVLPTRQLLASATDGAKEDIRTVVKDIPAAPSAMASIPSMDEMLPAAKVPVASTKTAMLSPAAPVGAPQAAQNEKFEAYRLVFDDKSEAIKASEQPVLDKIIKKLNEDTTIRLQMRSYANGTAETSSAARRLSLMRALKMRDYLVQHKVDATRLDIRALGKGSAEMGDEVGTNNAPADRVDVIFTR